MRCALSDNKLGPITQSLRETCLINAGMIDGGGSGERIAVSLGDLETHKELI
jgi:hypothetical protein